MVASDLDLVLDVEIRNNVLLSILVTMFCLSLIRTYFFHALFGPSPPTLEKVYDEYVCPYNFVSSSCLAKFVREYEDCNKMEIGSPKGHFSQDVNFIITQKKDCLQRRFVSS